MTRTDTSASTDRRPLAATAVGALAVLGALGSVGMVAAHLALDMPVVAAVFAGGTLLFGLVAYGAFARTSWVWPVGLVVNGLGLASALLPWRGLERSGLPALVTLVALALLISRPGRDALLYRHR